MTVAVSSGRTSRHMASNVCDLPRPRSAPRPLASRSVHVVTHA